MGIMKRMKTVFSSNVNALISKAEDPEKMLNQIIIDMNEQLVKSKKAVAMAIADEKKLEREVRTQQEQAQEWERKAMLAVRAGDDGLAREALLRQQEYAENYKQLNEQWTAQKESVNKLKDSLRELQNKIDEAQRKKNLLIARAKRAEAQQKIQSTMSSMSGSSSSFEAFDRMAKKVEQIEAEADAALELEDLSRDGDLEKRFADLEKAPSSADLMLEQLKQKMALPDGTGEA